MKKKLTIVKIGGNVIDDEEALHHFMNSFSKLEGSKILVHGGGKAATEIALQMNLPQQMVNGRRITNAATLKIITMVYAGWINKTIVAGLHARDCHAIGFSGADGDLIRAQKRAVKEVDYGFVGDIISVNSTLLHQCLENRYSIVVAPLTHDGNGGLLNTNADTIAQCIAVALADSYDVQLIYCFEKKGILKDMEDESSYIKRIDWLTAAALQQEGVIHSGMLPKIHNALQAVEAGVKNVAIGRWDALQEIVNGNSGTQIQ